MPNLGQFLVARLLSDVDRGAAQTHSQQESTTIAIVKEAIVRNVVWTLSSHTDRHGCRPELAYLERNAYSGYRTVQTFKAGTTSWRLLMFQELMRRTVLATYGNQSLDQIRKELFNRHGAPPHGTAAALASEIRKIQVVQGFPAFFKALDIQQPPSRERFTDFLRRSIQMSHDAGYSVPALRQSQALYLRRRCEQDVDIHEGESAEYHHGKVSFFPRR